MVFSQSKNRANNRTEWGVALVKQHPEGVVCQGVHSVASLDKALSRKGKVQPRKHPTDGTAWVILVALWAFRSLGVKVKLLRVATQTLTPNRYTPVISPRQAPRLVVQRTQILTV